MPHFTAPAASSLHQTSSTSALNLA